jgi:signal recognition particle subunit SRP54
MPTARKQAGRQASKKKSGRRVSGNPAKRNAQLSAEPTAAGGNPAAAFGAGEQLDEKALQQAMADFQLPPELRGRLGK